MLFLVGLHLRKNRSFANVRRRTIFFYCGLGILGDDSGESSDQGVAEGHLYPVQGGFSGRRDIWLLHFLVKELLSHGLVELGEFPRSIVSD